MVLYMKTKVTVRAEATYFYEADGIRVNDFIVDIDGADQIPVMAEPLFSTEHNLFLLTFNAKTKEQVS